MLASLTRSNPSTGPDRLASIRSRLVLGLLLPYVCLMGVCAVALFAGPADTNRLPALLVLVGAAVLLPAAMARIARTILGEVEALETERATLATGEVARDAGVTAPDPTVGEPSAALEASTIEAAGGANATEVVPGDEVAVASAPTREIDEDAPIAAAVAMPEQADARVMDDEPSAMSEPEGVDEEAPIAAAATADNDAMVSSQPEGFDLDALLAAAVAARQRTMQAAEPEAAEPEAAEPEAAEPEAAPRPMLTPSTIGRQVLTGAAAEPAA